MVDKTTSATPLVSGFGYLDEGQRRLTINGHLIVPYGSTPSYL